MKTYWSETLKRYVTIPEEEMRMILYRLVSPRFGDTDTLVSFRDIEDMIELYPSWGLERDKLSVRSDGNVYYEYDTGPELVADQEMTDTEKEWRDNETD